MGSKKEIIAAIDAVGVAYDSLLALPLHTLTRSEGVLLLQRMDEMNRRVSGFDLRLLGRLITEAAPAQFGGASWACCRDGFGSPEAKQSDASRRRSTAPRPT